MKLFSRNGSKMFQNVQKSRAKRALVDMGMPVLSSLSFTFFSMNSISARIAKYKHVQTKVKTAKTQPHLEAIEDLDHPQSFHIRVSVCRKPPGKDRRMVKNGKE
jgi:hypothetical protein